MKKKTIRRLEIFLHILTAVILLLKGYDQLSKGIYFPAFILFGFGLLVITIILFWRQLKIRPKQARVSCYFIEAPALLVTAYVLSLEGRDSLPYIFSLASLLYPAVGFISTKSARTPRKLHS